MPFFLPVDLLASYQAFIPTSDRQREMFFSSKPRNIFDRPTTTEQVLSSPLKYLIRLLRSLFILLRRSPTTSSPLIRVVCIADTHTLKTDAIPDGDLLIHAGDLTDAGNIPELQDAIDWLASLPHKHKVAIAGNHDTYLDPRSREHLKKDEREGELDWKGIHYLQHSSVTLSFPASSSHASGKTTSTSPQRALTQRRTATTNANHEPGTRTLEIYGAPQIPACGPAHFAFQYLRNMDAWTNTIPRSTSILVTHTPPRFHLDNTGAHLTSLGCQYLLDELWQVKPRLHVFGHIHVGAGREVIAFDGCDAAYARAMGRDTRKMFAGGILDFWMWWEMLWVVYYGVVGVLWERVWGGEGESTILVNAALIDQRSGRLERKVQVVDI